MKSVFLLWMASVTISYAQTSRTIYFDSQGKVTLAAKASSYSVITRQPTDTTVYAVETFYASHRPMATGQYRAIAFPVRWEKIFTYDFGDALKEGTHQEYHANSQLKFQGDFKNGRGENLHQRWYENGQLLSSITLVKGKNEGLVSNYYKNGQLKQQYSCSSGLPQGLLTTYDEQGSKKSETRLENGVTVGKATRYDTQGQALPDE